MSDTCPARYDTASAGIVFCSLPPDGHTIHRNPEADARWSDDYVPKEAK